MAATSPVEILTVVTLYGRDKSYNTIVDMANGGHGLIHYDSLDGIERFTKASITISTPSGQVLPFNMYQVRVHYMSHMSPEVRHQFSSTMCTDFYKQTPSMWREDTGLLPKTWFNSGGGSAVTVHFNEDQCSKSKAFLDRIY